VADEAITLCAHDYFITHGDIIILDDFIAHNDVSIPNDVCA
jgi:hypothetical protein